MDRWIDGEMDRWIDDIILHPPFWKIPEKASWQDCPAERRGHCGGARSPADVGAAGIRQGIDPEMAILMGITRGLSCWNSGTLSWGQPFLLGADATKRLEFHQEKG